MKPIGDLVARAIGRPGLARAARALHIARCWPDLVGEKLAERSAVSDYDEGALWVTCESASAATEIRLRQPTLIAALNEKAGEMLFTEIRVTTRPVRHPQP